MSYSTGFLHDVVAILNRDEPDDNSSFGLDANGITWHQDCCVHANVGYSKGKAGILIDFKQNSCLSINIHHSNNSNPYQLL